MLPTYNRLFAASQLAGLSGRLVGWLASCLGCLAGLAGLAGLYEGQQQQQHAMAAAAPACNCSSQQQHQLFLCSNQQHFRCTVSKQSPQLREYWTLHYVMVVVDMLSLGYDGDHHHHAAADDDDDAAAAAADDDDDDDDHDGMLIIP